MHLNLHVVGLDLSLTSTGVASITGPVTLRRIAPKGATGADRLDRILREVMRDAARADLVVIEGPSYGSATGSAHERGGLWWLVRHALWAASVDVAVVPPATLKKYATGKGNASKDQVLAAVIRRYPDVMVTGNDEADALVLAAMAADRYGFPLAEMPQASRSALASVDWPSLARVRPA